MGRKPRAGSSSDLVFQIRMTAEERQRIESAAVKAGKTASAWAREILLENAPVPASAPVKKKPRK